MQTIKVGSVSHRKSDIRDYGRSDKRVLVYLVGRGYPWVHKYPTVEEAKAVYEKLNSFMKGE